MSLWYCYIIEKRLAVGIIFLALVTRGLVPMSASSSRVVFPDKGSFPAVQSDPNYSQRVQSVPTRGSTNCSFGQWNHTG
jgi:hypothetical protein